MHRYDPIEHCKWCDSDYDANKQSIHCPHDDKPKPVSEREKIATEIEHMYGPHDKLNPHGLTVCIKCTAKAIADRIREN